MTDDFAITGELHSLPPSYKRPCLDYVMKENHSPFHEVLAKVDNFKGITNAGIVIDREGIFDIRVINVFPHKTLIAVD